MKKIALISTGGTIASKYDEKTGKLMAGELTGEELLARCDVEELESEIDLTVKSLFQIPSNQMSFDKNILIYEELRKMEKEGYDAFVVTHGTDTMEESSYFISLLWDSSVPVVFTGSQVSPTENNTDAFHNVSNALLVAACDQTRDMGVLVAFNDKIFDAQYVSKIHSSNIDGFGSIQNGPLGTVDYGRVHYFQKPAFKDTYKLEKEFPKVEILTQYVDINPEIVDFHIEQGTKGLIVEGFGRGHTTLKIAEKLELAMEKGITVVITSTCRNGEVEPIYGYKGSVEDLLNMGAINGYGYMTKKARIKLMLLLSKDLNREEIQESFKKF